MTKTKIFLTLLFVVSLILRIYQYKYPPLLWDEASLGYNAYSILKTGKDEYGQTLPLIFKSFGDYKPGLYVYLTVPFVAVFGLNPLSVRLPSILLGSLTPILLFFFLRQKNKKIAYIAAVLLAFNPYNIHFSRGAWETNILTFELLLASYLFFKNKYLLSSLAFASTLYTYQGGKLISLLLIAALLIIQKINLKKYITTFVLPLGILAIPIAWGILFSSNGNRLGVISLFSYPRDPVEVNTITSETNIADYTIFHAQPSFFLRNALTRYFNHFSPKFLFFQGDWQSPRHSAPYLGVILYPSLIFLVIGLFSLVNHRSPITNYFSLWLLAAPIPAALTRDIIQAVRSMSLSIPLIYFISIGIYQTIVLIKLKPARYTIVGLIFIAYCLSFVYYSDLYLNHMVKKSPKDFLYGYQQAANYVIENQTKFQHIDFTNFYGQPYIFYLFYSQYPPIKYQSQAMLTENSQGDAGTIDKIDNINFTSTDFQKIKSTPSSLGIFSHDEILRQGIDKDPVFSKFIPLSPINGLSTFYAYQNP